MMNVFAWLPGTIPDESLRSWQLLRAWLSPEQLLEFDNKKLFHVVGNVTKIKYVIFSSSQYNIINTKNQVRLCVSPATDRFYICDVMLAQKIALENDERGALRVANHRPRYPYEPEVN